MEVKTNEKGRGAYATKEYQPWDIIHVEKSIFSISSVCNQNYVDTAKKNKDQHVAGSFINRMLSFIASAPDSKVKSQHAHLKFPILYLLNGGKVEALSHLAKVSKLGVNEKQIRNAAKTFKLPKEDLKTVAQVVQANGFSIPGLFFTEIGMCLFDQASMLNHSCDPNAFTFITFDKILVFARKPILLGEEITISYKPLCVPNAVQLLDFECKCGKCGKCGTTDSNLLKEVYEKFSQTQTVHERIDFMLGRCSEIPCDDFIQLLIEGYYEIWATNGTYREKELLGVLQKFRVREPSSTWIEAQLLCLILVSRLGLKDQVPIIREKLQPFLENRDIIEHVVVTTTMIPHIYHNSLIAILDQTNLLP